MEGQQHPKKIRGNHFFLIALLFCICSFGVIRHNNVNEKQEFQLFSEKNNKISKNIQKELRLNDLEYDDYKNHWYRFTIICDTNDGNILKFQDYENQTVLSSKLKIYNEIVYNYFAKFTKVNVQFGALKGEKWRKHSRYAITLVPKSKNKISILTSIIWESK